MPAGGWIPLWRKAFKSKWSPANQGRPYTEFEAWLDLLCLVVQKPDGDVVKMPGKQPYFLGSGEILTTFRGLQARWRWGSHNKVRRFIRSLCTLESVIVLDTNPLHLKIVNAETYGLVRTKNGPKTDQARTKDGPVQQVNKVNNETSRTTVPVPPHDFETFWTTYPKARRMAEAKSLKLWSGLIAGGATANDLLSACRNYAEAKKCAVPQFIMHTKRFLGPDQCWLDFVDGIPEGERVEPDPNSEAGRAKAGDDWLAGRQRAKEEA